MNVYKYFGAISKGDDLPDICAHGVPFADTDAGYVEACEDCREEHSHGIEEQAIERGGY